MAKNKAPGTEDVKQIKIVCRSSGAFDEIVDWLTAFGPDEIPEKIINEKEMQIAISVVELFLSAIVETLPFMDNVKDINAFIEGKELALSGDSNAATETNELMDAIVDAFKKDLRNKVFASTKFILSFVKDETGKDLTASDLGKIIKSYQSGKLKGKANTEIFDASVFACNALGRACFNLDEDHDCTITWLEDVDPAIAEIRE